MILELMKGDVILRKISKAFRPDVFDAHIDIKKGDVVEVDGKKYEYTGEKNILTSQYARMEFVGVV